MAAPTAALDTNHHPGPLPGPSGMIIERVKITGNTSVVGDTVSYVSNYLRDCVHISPGYSFTESLSANGASLTVTIKLQHAIAGTDVEHIELIGFP